MKRLWILLLTVLILYTLSSCTEGAREAMGETDENTPTYLIAGLDDASGNTDVLLLLRYREGMLSVVQIPRDTYCNTGLSQNKINQIYAASVSAGMTEKGALTRLSDTVSEVLGTPIDGYIAVTTSGVSRVIDRIGGVEVTLYESLTLDDGERTLSLAEGKHTLSGEDALLFIRHRKGYLTGDIARLDVQKLFLHGFLTAIRERLGTDDVLALLPLCEKDIITDQTILDVTKTAVKYLPKFKKSTIVYLTLPGEAAQAENGLWYYVLNRKCAIEALVRHMEISAGGFDRSRRLTDGKRVHFENIYDDNHMSYREYGEEDLPKIRIPRG